MNIDKYAGIILTIILTTLLVGTNIFWLYEINNSIYWLQIKDQQLRDKDKQLLKIDQPNSDKFSVIDSWNKVMEKEYQMEKLLTDNAVYHVNDLDSWIQQQQNTIGKLDIFIQEENNLISDFAGSSVIVEGDANKYANNAAGFIREIHVYRIDQLKNLKELVKARQFNDYQHYDNEKIVLDGIDSQIKVYRDKANDEIRKLQALQR